MKKIIDFHILSYQRFGGKNHVVTAAMVIQNRFNSYEQYRKYCKDLHITHVTQEVWEEQLVQS